MGVVSPHPMPTYPDGFPDPVIDLVRTAGGREVVCNRPYNGLEAIADFGAEHLRTGALIVYTSQDSVLQIAAHEQVMPTPDLYEICRQVRHGLRGEHAVGRVIARPFRGSQDSFERSDGRRDYSLAPPARSYLDECQDAGVPVHTVGKVGQLFDGVGIDVQHPGATNARALDETTQLIRELSSGLVFTNLVDTDQVYGHRHDVPGFHRALAQIDSRVADWTAIMRPQDLLVLTADHGCDPTCAHTDHTREHVPLLASFEGHGSRRHDGPMADVGASALMWLTGRQASLPGTSFVDHVGDR
jgi:phosphopentomutase